MKTSLRKYLSLVMVLCVAFVCLFAVNVKAATEVARFDFGEYDASKTDEGSQDGSKATTYTEESGDYTLELSSLTNVYKGSYDAKGNSCLKLGTSSKVGSFSFVVPNDIEQVGILVAGYKAKTVTVTVNGSSEAISTKSSNGAYTEVFVDTKTNKTVEFATTSTGYRCKIDAIVYYAAGASTTPSINISGNAYAEVNDGAQLTSTTANTTGTVVWASSNESVATVDQDGYVTALVMGATTITATVDGVEDSVEFNVYPEDGSELTIAEALTVCDLTGQTNCVYTYSTTGEVASIDTAYDSGYGNITVTITDGTNSIKAYRMAGGSDLCVGDEITVTGTLVNYGGNTPEFVAGCTYIVKSINETAHNVRTALNSVAAYMSLGYKYTSKQVAAPAYVEIVAENLGYENGTAVESLTEGVVSIVFDKGTNSNAPKYYTTGKAIRCYGGNLITFTATTNITSIELTFASGEGTNAITADCGTFNTDTWTGSSNSVVLTIGGTTGHRRIATIKVSYEGGSSVSVTEYLDVDFRIRCGVDKKLSNIEGVDEYGIKVSTSSAEKSYASTSEFFKEDAENSMYYVMISLGDVLNITSRLTEEFTVVAYVVIDGVTYESTITKTYSVLDMVKQYKEAGNPDVSALYADLITLGFIDVE